MKKIFWIFILMMTLSVFTLSGCGKDPYKNMQLIVDQTSVEIVLDHNEDDADAGQEGQQVVKNTGTLTARIENKNKKQSKRVLFDIMDKSLATLAVTEKDGVYQATIYAKAPGDTLITVMSLEGNKIQYVPLKVIEPITGLSFDPDFKLAVAVGENYQFSNSYINFAPTTTNQKDVTYSLSEQYEGVSITTDGLLSVTSKPANGYVEVIATSTVNQNLFTKTNVYIYNSLSIEDIKIVNENQEEVETIQVGKNTIFNNVPLFVKIENSNENFVAYAEVEDNSVLNVNRTGEDKLSFIAIGIEQSETKIKFKIGIDGITQQQFIEKTINVQVLDFVDTIYVNGSSRDSTLVIYDTYANTTETAFGTRVLVELAPTNSVNKKITFKADQTSLQSLQKLEFYTSSGKPIENILNYELNNASLFFVKTKVDAEFTEFDCKLTLVANSDFGLEAEVYNEITIKVKKGIKNLSFKNDKNFIEYKDGDFTEFNYLVNDVEVTDANISTLLSGFDLSEIKLLVQKSSILSAKIEKGKLYIKPLAPGITTLSLRAPNGIATQPATIRVVVPAQEVNVEIDKYAYKEEIASIERDENGFLSKINLNVDSTIALHLEKNNANATIWDLQFSSNRSSVATVTTQGTIRCLSTGLATISVTYKYAGLKNIEYDDGGNIIFYELEEVAKTEQVELFVFKQITKFDIGKRNVTTYDVNTIGYYDAGLYSTVDFSVQMSDAFITKDKIKIYINGEPFNYDEFGTSYKIVGKYGILFYHGKGKATFLAKNTVDGIDPVVSILAEVHEFDRVYRSICDIKIIKAKQVDEIVVYNADVTTKEGKDYYNLNFKVGEGLGDNSDNKKILQVKTNPGDAINKEVLFFAYDHEQIIGDEITYVNISEQTPESEIIKVSQDGIVTPLKSGRAKIIIIPRDRLVNFDLDNDGTLTRQELLRNLQHLQLNNASSKYYREILVQVSDGTLENPYNIANAVDFLNISKDLDAHYVLTQTVDLSGVTVPVLGGVDNPFAGSLNGRYYIDKENDVYVDSKVIGINLEKTFAKSQDNINFALFGIVKGVLDEDGILVSSFSNLDFYFDDYNVEILNENQVSQINLGYLTAQFSGKMENVELFITKQGTISNQTNAKLNFGAVSAVVSQYEYLNGEEQKSKTSELKKVKVIGDGKVEINAINSESHIGGFVGILNNNCNLNGDYKFANDIASDGGFVFTFSGQDNDCQLDLIVRTKNMSIDDANTFLMSVGGVVGKNNGVVSQISVASNIQVLTHNDFEAGQNIGGIVGLNEGNVEDVFSRCVVVGDVNVGGIAGTNKNKISSAIYESYEDDSSYVQGIKNVGGIVGLMQGGELEFCSASSFFKSTNKYAVTGYSNIGGLVGYVMTATQIQKSYTSLRIGIKTQFNEDKFVSNFGSEKWNAFTVISDAIIGGFIGTSSNAEKILNCYSITDVALLDSGNSTIRGGFIGKTLNTNNIGNCYSFETLILDSNFVGDSQGSLKISNSYYLSSTEGQTSGGAYSRTESQLKDDRNYGAWDLITTYSIDSAKNEGLPYLLYKDNLEFLTVVPTSLSIIVNDSVDNKFIKVDDEKIVLFNQQGLTSNENYEIELKDILKIQTLPSSNRIIRVKAMVVNGQDVIKIKDGKLIVLKEGYAKIKIVSQLNEEIFDTLEIYVTNGIRSFASDIAVEKEKRIVKLLVGTSKEINYSFANSEQIGNETIEYKVGQNFGIAYSGLDTYATMNFAETQKIGGVNYVCVDSNLSKIITANKVTPSDLTITQKVYVNAIFGGQPTRVFVPNFEEELNFEEEFTLSIYNGATNLDLDKDKMTITPNQKASVKATIKTDVVKIGEIVDKIQITLDNELKQTTQIDYNGISKTFEVTQNEDDLFDVIVTGANYDSDSQKMEIYYEFLPKEEVKKTATNLTFNITFLIANKEDLSANFVLTITPQPVEKISILHFADGSISNEDEVASDRISSGVKGLLKINVYPTFSQIDHIDLTSSQVNGEVITFVQYVMVDGELERIYPSSQNIPNGIRLKLASQKSGNDYVFDGYIYVETLIRSDMAENLPFLVTLTAYRGTTPVFVEEKILLTQFSPLVKMNYEQSHNGKYARGTTINFPVAIRSMSGTLTTSVEVKNVNGQTNSESALKVGLSLSQSTFNGRYVGTVKASLQSNVTLEAGSKIIVRLTLSTIIDNIKVMIVDEIQLDVVDFVITGVMIDTAYSNGQKNMLDIDLNMAKALKAKVLAVYAVKPSEAFVTLTNEEKDAYKEIVAKLSALEESITSQNGEQIDSESEQAIYVWYEAGQSFDKKENITGEYYRYKYMMQSESKYYSIYGVRVSASEQISLSVSYYYDKNGNVVLCSDQKNGCFRKTFTVTLNVTNKSTEEVPLPIYTQAEFESMQAGAHYILMDDIELKTYKPLEANFASLDGNGKMLTLKSFLLEKSNSTMNVGLFSTVSNSTVVKNIVLNINPLTNNIEDLTNVLSLNFGWIAGVNNGVITNCDVINLKESDSIVSEDQMIFKVSQLINSSYTTTYIGMFVGKNEGFITNSRVGRTAGSIGELVINEGDITIDKDNYKVEKINLTANGVVAGFVALNLNSISSCYVKNIIINNNSVIPSISATAGFVAMNSGRISGSYGEGYAINEEVVNDFANLKSQGSVAGFVHENSGEISNSYSKFVMRSPSNTAGFVFKNLNKASIKFTYTASSTIFAENGSEFKRVFDNASFRPFTGVDDFNEIQNKGTIEYSYYVKPKSTAVFADELAIAIDGDDKLAGENTTKRSEYIGFAFIENASVIDEGIWSITENGMPSLVTADFVTVSIRELVSSDANHYVYTYDPNYSQGSKINPYIVDTPLKFNNYINKDEEKESVGDVEKSRKYIRIVKDLNFAQSGETSANLTTSKVAFKGILDGNNMLLSNINLNGENSQQTEFGLLKRLDNSLIKNLRLNFASVSATEVPLVGGLAGSALNSILIGISIDSPNASVQGKNVVGGLVGALVGECEIYAVDATINVRATYRKGSIVPTFTDAQVLSSPLKESTSNYMEYVLSDEDNDKLYLYYENTSYAGGLLGAVLMNDYEDESVKAQKYAKQIIKTLKVDGAVSISAEKTGGVIALNYGKLQDLFFNVQIDGTQELYGEDAVGGLVGVNYGSIDKGRVTYIGKDLEIVNSLAMGVKGGRTNLFIGTSNYIGGLVGKNIDGSIENSYSRVDVVNLNAKYAGGLVGYNQAGSFNQLYTTANVQSKEAFGGMFGYMDTLSIMDEVTQKETKKIINSFSGIVLVNNFNLATAQEINLRSTGGSLSGFVNAVDIGEIFEFSGANNTNFAIKRLALNSAGTSNVSLNYFAKAQYNRLEITQEQYNQRINDFNAMKKNDKNYVWFDTGIYNFAELKTKNIFETYSVLDWTKDSVEFPLLKITSQLTEVVITEDNKADFVKLLEATPNATFIIRTDINLKLIADGGDLNDPWKSLGSIILPYGGKIQGELGVYDKTSTKQRYPIITLSNNSFINFARNAKLSNLVFNTTEFIVDDADNAEDFYFGAVANNLQICALSNITLTNTAYSKSSNLIGNSIKWSTTRKFDSLTGKIASNYVGAMFGYVFGGSISNIHCSVPMEISAQGNLKSYVGGVAGYLNGVKTSNISYNVNYRQQGEHIDYKPFRVNMLNGYVGAVVGMAERTELEKIQVLETPLNVVNENFENANKAPIIFSNTSKFSSESVFGGLIGMTTSNSSAKDISNNLSSIELSIEVKDSITYIGGVTGIISSSTFTKAKNNSKLKVLTNSNTDDDLFLGGVAGQLVSGAYLNGENKGEINSEGCISGKIGGLVGQVLISKQNITIYQSRNTANLNVSNYKNALVGGLVGSIETSTQVLAEESIVRILESYNDGDIKAQGNEGCLQEYIGGFVGYANRINAENSYSVGYLISKTLNITKQDTPNYLYNQSIGGFIGRLESNGNQPRLDYCYTATVVKVYGESLTKIDDDYNSLVNSKPFIGSTSLSGTFNTCYYVNGFAEVNASYDSTNKTKMHDTTAMAKSLYDFTNTKTFVRYNFTDIWTTENLANTTAHTSLPMLKWALNSMEAKKYFGSVYKPRLLTSFDITEENTIKEYYIILPNSNLNLDNVDRVLKDFDGVIDGSGCTLSLKQALFDELGENSVVTNFVFNIVNEQKEYVNQIGVVANVNKGAITYVTTKGTITLDDGIGNINIGGVVAENYGYIGFVGSYVEITQKDLNDNQEQTTASNVNIGGIAGIMANNLDENQKVKRHSQITNSFASGTLTLKQTLNSSIGGFVGEILSGAEISIRDSFANGRINHLGAPNATTYGPIFGANNGTLKCKNFYNDYFSTLVKTGNTMDASPNMFFGGQLPAGFDINVWGYLSSQNKETQMYNYGYPYHKYGAKFVTGLGTSNNAYKIRSQSGFELVNYFVGKGEENAVFILERDIYCLPNDSFAINTLKGTLDGASHKIINLYINDNSQALINLNEGKVQNITFENALLQIKNEIRAGSSFALVVGNNIENATISNIKMTNIEVKVDQGTKVTNSGDNQLSTNIGVLVGANYGKVSGSNANAIEMIMQNSDLDSSNKINLGGMVGRMFGGEVKDCVVESLTIYGTKTEDTYSGIDSNVYGNVGGFVGLLSKGKIINSRVGSSTPKTYENINIYLLATNESCYLGGFAGYVSENLGVCLDTIESRTRLNIEKGATFVAGNFVYVGGVVGWNSSIANKLTMATVVNDSSKISLTNSIFGNSSGTDAFTNSTNELKEKN